MSCFIVSHRVINNILSGVYKCYEKDYMLDYKIRKFFNIEELKDFLSDSYLTKLGRELIRMNIKSVNSYYHHNYSNNHASKYKFQYNPDCSLEQSYKSIDCLEYQSSELPEYENLKTYKKLQMLKARIADTIVTRLKGYSEAEWD